MTHFLLCVLAIGIGAAISNAFEYALNRRFPRPREWLPAYFYGVAAVYIVQWFYPI